MPPDPSAREPELTAALAGFASSALGYVQERVELAEQEWRLEVARLKALALAVGVGVAAAFLGFQLLTAGLLLLLAEWLGRPWALLVGAGLLYLVVGGALVWRRTRAFAAARPPFSHTLAELRKDRQWLARERP